MFDGNEQDHVTFRVHVISHDVTIRNHDVTTRNHDVTIENGSTQLVKKISDASLGPPPILRNRCPSLASENLVSSDEFCALFPFHIIFDKSLTIKQCGDNVQKVKQIDSTNIFIIYGPITRNRPKIS